LYVFKLLCTRWENFHSNAILNIKMYPCISLGLKITQIKIPRNIVERLWHINNVTSYEDFPFKMQRSDVIWLRVRFNFDRIAILFTNKCIRRRNITFLKACQLQIWQLSIAIENTRYIIIALEWENNSYRELSNLQLTCLKECYIPTPNALVCKQYCWPRYFRLWIWRWRPIIDADHHSTVWVNTMNLENVKSYMSYVQQNTKII
jgi:hypothetical protein